MGDAPFFHLRLEHTQAGGSKFQLKDGGSPREGIHGGGFRASERERGQQQQQQQQHGLVHERADDSEWLNLRDLVFY